MNKRLFDRAVNVFVLFAVAIGTGLLAYVLVMAIPIVTAVLVGTGVFVALIEHFRGEIWH